MQVSSVYVDASTPCRLQLTRWRSVTNCLEKFAFFVGDNEKLLHFQGWPSRALCALSGGPASPHVGTDSSPHVPSARGSSFLDLFYWFFCADGLRYCVVDCETPTSCKDMPRVVWSNLKAHNYRDDLTRPSGSGEEGSNVSPTQTLDQV